MSRTSAYARLSRIVIFLFLTFSATFGQVNGSALVSALTGKTVVPTVELGYSGSVANPLMVNGHPATFPVKTLVYPDGHESFRVESGILHADAAQYKTFNRGLEFRIGKVELKGDYLELKLPSVTDPKLSAVVKLMLGSGWQTTMTNEAVLKMADRFLSDPSQPSATVAAKAQPPASQNNTTDASPYQAPDNLATSEASAKPISVISIGDIPAYSLTPSIQLIETFPANTRMCIESEPITFKGGKFLQLFLEGPKAYTPVPVNRQIFTPNPAGDPDCNKLAARLANPQQSSQVATNPTSVSHDTADYKERQARFAAAVAAMMPLTVDAGAPDNTKPFQMEISDPSMLADIAEINKGDPSFLKGRDPRLPSVEVSIGDLFYGRRSLTPGGGRPRYGDYTLQKVKHWGADKSFHDFVEASRWYKEAKTRLLAFNPALSAPQTAGCVYPQQHPDLRFLTPEQRSFQESLQPFYKGSSNCNGYDDYDHARQMEVRADNQLSPSGVAEREQAKKEDAEAEAAKENLAKNVPKCDDKRMFAEIYRSVRNSPSGIAGGLRMTGISQIEEASDLKAPVISGLNSSTSRVCYAMGEFNDGTKLIRYIFELRSKGIKITVAQPGGLESLLYLGAHMDK